MNNVTFLASTVAGERHYLGFTSGDLFGKIVGASVDISNTHPSSSPTDRGSCRDWVFRVQRL